MELKDFQNPGVVEVTWLDSVMLQHGEWMDIDELRDNLDEGQLLHKTVGYLLGESEVAIALGHSINAQDDIPTNRVAGGMVIPKSAIKNIETFREKA